MLSLLAQKMVRLRSLATLTPPARSFHQTLLMMRKRSKWDDGSMNPCPESQMPDCRVIKQRYCNPLEPIRSCDEIDCNETRDSCCVNTRIRESPCTQSVKASEFKKRRPPFESMWESYKGKKFVRPEALWHYPKECCPKCEDVRFDVLYYSPSNKCRDYQRTWWECCPRMVPKRVCCWCDAVPPQVLRRRKPICAQSACTQGHEGKRLECHNKRSKGCQRLRMPCCRTARIPPSCKRIPHPSDCEKIRCPFPSYSECLQEDPAVIPERPPECECLKQPPLCVQLRRAHHMGQHNISLYPCDR